MGLHDDGAKLAHVEDPRLRTCEVCGGPLSTETWWVTKFPKGEHGKCRDWTKHPFPFDRHRDVLKGLARRLPPDGASAARAGLRALDAHRRAWPGGGWASVQACMQIVARARAQLAACAVEAKVLSKL